ncbi:MAG: hypothetical protein QXQ66_07645 [Candidatus Hadarchaeum sp.]|uniref:hypothetical protein n=1 Tax=Candidatus Hadarchaeum sp. TaxID=2883567 RepID=UPI0031799A5E
MANARVAEGVRGLAHDLSARLLFANLAENLAEVCAIVQVLGFRDLPPELLTRLRAIEADLREMRELCRFPPVL